MLSDEGVELMRADATFTVSNWDEHTVQELADPAKVTRAAITQEFEGELAATGAAELVMAYQADGTARFAGYQVFTGELGGRKGGFVMACDGAFEEGVARTHFTVVAGSGTGELAGLQGSGDAEVGSEPPGKLTLEYDVD
jgi:hypothetical protein